MADKTGKVYLCKDINLDKDYINVLNYTEQNMLDLCTSGSHLVASKTNCSFIRQNVNEILIEVPYGTALMCNYMAFQNPDYSNKWFFAFIDEVIYDSDSSTRIKFTIDEHSTWFDYWDAKSCLVLREHVSSDNVGEHTYPEDLEHGDYICNASGELGGFTVDSSKIIVATTWLPNNTTNLPTTQYYGGVFSGVYFVAFDPFSAYAKNFILALDGFGRGDAIVAVFMAPSSLCTPITSFTGTLHSKINNDDGTTSPHDFYIEGGFIGNNQGGNTIASAVTISMQTTLDGYSPRNKKCLVYPYNILLMTNNCGGNAEYKYEDFISNVPIFNINGTLSPGCSIKLFPSNYKKIADDIATGNRPGFSYGLMASKFPICSYQNDAFTNWMTQQAVNVKGEQIRSALKIGGMFFNSSEGVGNPAESYMGLINQQLNYMNQVYQHALVSPQQGGSLNGADIAYAINEVNFRYYKMSIRSEYAQMIDSYFDKYGYKINLIKVPNMVSRTYWNYLQIGTQEDIGYSNSSGSVPARSMNIINNIYRRGVTIWHQHNNIGNYSLNNTII